MPRKAKPSKREPIERFPTKPRADGRFQKRIRNQLYYFGFGGDRKLALAEYDRVKHALYAGRAPIAATDGFTLKQLANRYSTERGEEVEAGRLNDGWHKQCTRAIRRFLKRTGGARVVDGLAPDDFADYARFLSQALGHHAYNRERESIVTMFRHAVDSGWIDRPVRFGKKFAKVSAGVIRENRRHRLIPPTTIALLLACADPQLEAMLLLALNGGYGATDCGRLPWVKVDMVGGIIRNYRRPKTHIDRDTPLWPETVEALAALRTSRPTDTLVFRTKYGKAWRGEAVAHRLSDLIESLNADPIREGLDKLDVVLGDLRHVFSTYANEAGDHDAVKRVMGHKLEGLKDVYVETLFIPRLVKVTDHVRSRVFNPSA